MYCIVIEVKLNSGENILEPIQQQDFKSLILRSLKTYVPEASVSFTGDGWAEQGYKWIVMAHTLEIVNSKTVSSLNKSFEIYAKTYGDPKIIVSVMMEQ